MARATIEEPASGAAPSTSPIIALRRVSRRFEISPATVTGLDSVDLAIAPGEFVVVLGPSGSGKTTLLNMIGALDSPTEGSIVVAGQEISGASRGELFAFRRHTVSFIFQSFNIFPGLTARENVQFGIDTAARAGSDGAARFLGLVGLGERLDHFPHELSGGERQRVAIARALATGNLVLLADEPTGELDFTTGGQILELLRAHVAGERVVLFVTHNREIARIADRVIELSGGRVVGDGPPPGGRAEVAALRW